MTTQTTAQTLLEKLRERPREIVDVEPEPGFIYQFKQPNTLGTVIGGELPTSMMEEAAAEWQKDGIGEVLTPEQIDEIETAKTEAQKMRDAENAGRISEVRKHRLIELSYNPVLVVGIADPAKNEISLDQLPDAHLTYLFQWIAAGGSVPLMLKLFPEQPLAGSDAGAGGKKLRAIRKQFGKAK